MIQAVPKIEIRDTALGPTEFAQLDGREVPITWRPQEGSQQLFLRRPYDTDPPILETLLEGGRGCGKTDVLLVDFLQHVGLGFGPAWRGVLFRRSFKQLDDVIAKSHKIFRAVCPRARYIGSAQARKWVFPDGETLLFRIFNTPKDYDNFHGHEYPWIAWEELTRWPTLEGYRLMMSCCRGTHPGVVLYPGTEHERVLTLPRKIPSTTNPYGVGHTAVKSYFGLPQNRGKVIYDEIETASGETLKTGRVAIHCRYEENKILLARDPGYMARILKSARNDSERRAWERGDWDIVAGGIFDGVWDGETHVVPQFDVPRTWSLNRSFDWGWSKPFDVTWWAESDGTDLVFPNGRRMRTIKGDLFAVRQWYGCRQNGTNEGLEMVDSAIAKGILEREAKWFDGRKPEPGPADTSIFDDVNANSIAVNMQKNGVRWTEANKSAGSRKQGWAIMRERMEAAKVVDGRPRENPGLFVCESCVDWIRLVPSLPRDDKDPDDVDTDAEDHSGDSARYRMFAKPKTLARKKVRGR